MRYAPHGLLFVLFISGFFVAGAQVRKPDDLATPRAAVERNLKTPEGCHYDEVISSQFSEQYESSMQLCTKAAPQKDLADFDIFMNVAGDGSVAKALVSPETKVATCLRGEVLRKGGFSVPPRPNYWIKIEMKITE